MHFSECGREGTLFDIVFIFDESVSIDATEFLDQIYFFQNVSHRVYVGENYARVAAVGASGSAREYFNLTTYITSAEVATALMYLPNAAGSSGYETSIVYAYNTLLANHRRAGATAIVVSITDYSSADTSTVQNLATTAATNGDIFIVIGYKVNVRQASTDTTNHFMLASTSADFLTYVDQVVSIICPRKSSNFYYYFFHSSVNIKSNFSF